MQKGDVFIAHSVEHGTETGTVHITRDNIVYLLFRRGKLTVGVRFMDLLPLYMVERFRSKGV